MYGHLPPRLLLLVSFSVLLLFQMHLGDVTYSRPPIKGRHRVAEAPISAEPGCHHMPAKAGSAEASKARLL